MKKIVQIYHEVFYMEKMFEKSDVLNSPIEAMVFDSSAETFPIRRHWHYFMEIIYMTKGSISFLCGENSARLSEGELAIFHPKAIHSIESADGSTPVYALLKFDINRLRLSSDYSPRLGEVFRRAEGNAKAPTILTQKQCESIGAKDIIFQCIEEIKSSEYGYGSVLDANVYILLTRIVRLWMELGYCVEHSDKHAASDSIYTITQYIDAHSGENINVCDLARQCGMSYSHFARSFKAIYRQSCKQFINYLRVNKACEYLMFTDHGLNYISQETGFSDCSHFIRVFKEIKGTTPKKYRDAHRK